MTSDLGIYKSESQLKELLTSMVSNVTCSSTYIPRRIVSNDDGTRTVIDTFNHPTVSRTSMDTNVMPNDTLKTLKSRFFWFEFESKNRAKL